MQQDATTEIELKLRLRSADAWETIFRLPALVDLLTELPYDEHLEAWYFDTADGALRQAGLAYRIRLEGGCWVATVKADKASSGGLHQRREWNVIIAEPEPSLDYFLATEAGPLLQDALGDEPLVRQFATVFDRRKANVAAADGSIIEVAADRGNIVAGEAQEPILELELELKAGDPAAVLALGAELARSLPVAAESRSKYFRALVLAGLAVAAPAARIIPPAAEIPAASGLGEMLVSQLALALAAYENFLRNTADIETVHRLRVQLRRLRSLLTLAKPLAEPDQYAKWQDELKVLSKAMNSLRETDVIISSWRQLTADDRLALAPPPWLGLMLQGERDNQVARAAAALEESRPTATLLAFWAAVVGKDGLLTATDQPLSAFAAARVAGWLASIRENGKNIDWVNVDSLHRLRIQGKKLRYALESLPGCDRKTRLLILRLKELQDCLGQRVDTRTIHQAMAYWLGQHASRVVHRDAGMLLGWSSRLGVEAGLQFDRVWRRFRRAARRWQKDAKDN